MRPKNCKSCGGNTKMYQTGGCFDAMGNSIPCDGTQLQGSSGVTWQNSQVPQQAPVNPALQGIDPALTMKMENQGSPYSITPDDSVKKQKKDPFAMMQRFGIGMRGARTALSWISGAIERGRQNKYDWQQQTALGQMNPMQVSDFQPTPNNMYAQMGGMNPFSAYSKYGGNLNKIMKEHQKFSNDAQFDFGSGDDDKGKMKKGGYEIDRMLIVRKLLPELFMMGRMGRHRWGNRYQLGGNLLLPQVPKMSGLFNQTTADGSDDVVEYQRNISKIAEVKGISRDEAKKLYASWGTDTGDNVQPISQSVPAMMQKTNYSVSYPDAKNPSGQGVTYYDDFAKWQAGVQGKQFVSQQISGDKSSASASLYGPMKRGGIHIKPENKGKFTDYCGGNVTNECIQKGLNSDSATIRKRANFARNARKWNN